MVVHRLRRLHSLPERFPRSLRSLSHIPTKYARAAAVAVVGLVRLLLRQESRSSLALFEYSSLDEQVVKARLQMRPVPGQPPKYTGVADVIKKTWAYVSQSASQPVSQCSSNNRIVWLMLLLLLGARTQKRGLQRLFPWLLHLLVPRDTELCHHLRRLRVLESQAHRSQPDPVSAYVHACVSE